MAAMSGTFLKLILLLSLLVILLGMPLLLEPHRIRPSSFACIRLGMTELDVEQLLGAKAGNYDGYVPVLFQPTVFGLAAMRSPKTWCARCGTLCIWFDEGGRVFHATVGDSEPAAWWARIWNRYFPPPEIDLIHLRF